MLAWHMLNVVERADEVWLFSERSKASTIRKYDGKYCRLNTGDRVTMFHTTDPASKDPAIITEFLQVRSYAIGTLDQLIKASDISYPYTPEDVLRFYPLAEGQERDPSELYIIIYF